MKKISLALLAGFSWSLYYILSTKAIYSNEYAQLVNVVPAHNVLPFVTIFNLLLSFVQL